MCGPEATLASQGVSAVSGAFSAFSKAQGQKQAYNTDAQMNDINAQMADLSARSASLQGSRQAETATMREGQIRGAQNAGYAARGVTLDSASVQRVAASTDVLSNIDVSTIKANASREAFGYQMQSINYSGKAATDRENANAISPNMALAGGLLTGASQVATTRYQMQKDGTLPKNDWLQRNAIGPVRDWFN